MNTAIDIYAFGMCALETAALELLPAHPTGSSSAATGNGSGNAGGAETSGGNGHHQNGTNGNQDNEGGLVTEESIQRTIGILILQSSLS